MFLISFQLKSPDTILTKLKVAFGVEYVLVNSTVTVCSAAILISSVTTDLVKPSKEIVASTAVPRSTLKVTVDSFPSASVIFSVTT